jgi:hypothetical protein
VPIELTCNGCGQTLRVPDEHAGKQARCPKCQTVQPIPAAPTSYGGYPPGPAAPQFPASPPPGQKSPPPYPSASGNPYADAPPAGSQNPYAPSSPASYAPPYGIRTRSWSKPHQGNTILTLGILSIVCCAIMGPIAWIMGQSDLKEIDRGAMDPSGRGTTQAGMILGIIGTVLLVLKGGFVLLAAAAN